MNKLIVRKALVSQVMNLGKEIVTATFTLLMRNQNLISRY